MLSQTGLIGAQGSNYSNKQFGGEKILTDKLVLFGILHCPGSGEEKANVLYSVFQDGGVDKQKWVSATDKDILPNLSKLIKLVSSDLAQLMEEVDEEHPMGMEDKAEDIDYQCEALIEDFYLDPVFGDNSRLEYLEFVKAHRPGKVHNVWFDPQALRMLTFHKAELESTNMSQVDHAQF